MKGLRACPICPKCGSKKFERLDDQNVKVKCLNCANIMPLVLRGYQFTLYWIAFARAQNPPTPDRASVHT